MRNKPLHKNFQIILRLIIGFLLVLLLTVGIYASYQIITLKLYVKNQEITVPELSSQQKIADFTYLTKYVEDCYPYANAVRDKKGLDSIISLKGQYIQQAGKTKDNLEFLRLFISYAQQLGQAGHYGIQWFEPENINNSFCYLFGLQKDAFYKTKYWSELASKLDLYVHSDLKIGYHNGSYYLLEDYNLNGIHLPKDTRIIQVDGKSVDEFVRSLQNKQVLRVDRTYNKVYAHNLFLNRTTQDANHWLVKFELDNQRINHQEINHKGINHQGTNPYMINPYRITNYVDMIPGYPQNDIHKQTPNLECIELTDQIGYIAVHSFLQEFKEPDRKAIQDFMVASDNRYTKLIIDVRGNRGGEPSYWMENLIRPLLKETVTYKEKTAVKKSYFDRMKLRYFNYRLFATNHLLNKKINHITDIHVEPYIDINEIPWNIYEITKQLTPANSFPFNGAVYVLCDYDTLSAGDSFVRAVKATGLGKVVGANTLGWGDIFMQPNYCALPNSGLILQMDIEMPFNSDGTINSIEGTKPDFDLLPYTYPTPYPDDYSLNVLLKDEWIQWCFKN